MPDKFSKKFFYLLAIFLISFFIFRVVTQKKGLIAIDGDGKGYYAYLPLLFNTHSFDWNKLGEKKTDFSSGFTNEIAGHKTNKYSPGTALLILPFFLIVYLFSLMADYSSDGFGFQFHYAVLAAGMFYLITGLAFLKKFLQTYSLKERNILITIIVFLLGTNLFYYTFYEPSMSHVYAFCCVNGFVYSLRKYFIHRENKYFYFATLLLAIATLIRPTHIILILAIPFLLADIKNFTALLHKKNILVGAFIFFAVIFIQPLFSFLQTGHFIIMPYVDEGFYFLHPEIINILFSFRKGLFIYTPLLLLSLFGFLYLFKTNKKQSLALGSWLLILIYALSSWWNWYYGDSFGQRAFIDYYFLFAFLFVLLIEKSKPLIKYSVITLSMPITLLNLTQTYQYKNGIIHPDAMNKEKYITTFLHIRDGYKNGLQGAPELFYIPNGKTLLKTSFCNFEKPTEGWNEKDTQLYSKAKSGHTVGVLDNSIEYGPTFSIPTNELGLNSTRKYISANLNYNRQSNGTYLDAYFVVGISDSTGATYFLKSEKIFSLEKNDINTWQYSEFGFRLPQLKSSKDKLVAYVWNNSKEKFFVDDIKLEFWGAN